MIEGTIVSILLLMEDALKLLSQDLLYGGQTVSILLLMEDALKLTY